MCGIAGFLGLNDKPLLAEMARRIAHRGPDGEGLLHDELAQVGLAHRRLAIIDTSDAAQQPMASCDARYEVIFNGEIYNFKALGEELRAAGYVFNPNSDTAILGPLYDRFGAAMLSRLNGIFAFAIWDRRKLELFVARDLAGVKPLYYSRLAHGLLFASEIKALTAYAGLDRTIDPVAIHDYLVRLWSPGVRTPFAGVSNLPPGHFIRARLDSFEIGAWAAARPNAAPQQPSRRVGQRVADLARLFDQVVADQCLSDVPVGAFLSGGVDSSAIVASMVAGGHKPLQTYCVGFSGDKLADEGFSDDLEHARRVAASLQTPLTPIFVSPPSAQDIEDLVYCLDEPQADPAPLYVGAIARAARADGIKVLLSGAGGDDVFSGYRRHKAAALRARLGGAVRLLPALAAASGFLGGPLRRRVEKLAYMYAGTDEQFLLRAFEFNQDAYALDVLGASVRESLRDRAPGWLDQALEKSRDEPLVERMLDLEMHGFLPDHNLNYTDKAAMAHGVEVRVPFLDERMLAFARETPWRLKTCLTTEKWILKRAVAARLPAEILNRKKTGFGAPVRQWIAGPMRAMVEDILGSQSFRERGLFDSAGVSRLMADTLSGRRDGAYLVLAVVMIELWMRRFGGSFVAAPTPVQRTNT